MPNTPFRDPWTETLCALSLPALVMGSDGFVRSFEPLLSPHRENRELTHSERFAARPSLRDLFPNTKRGLEVQQAASSAFHVHALLCVKSPNMSCHRRRFGSGQDGFRRPRKSRTSKNATRLGLGNGFAPSSPPLRRASAITRFLIKQTINFQARDPRV